MSTFRRAWRFADGIRRGTCTRCGRSLASCSGYLFDGAQRCLFCTLHYWPLLRRSMQTALVVGTVLMIINHGLALLRGDSSSALFWEIPLTYVVPFCVATWGALNNNRR